MIGTCLLYTSIQTQNLPPKKWPARFSGTKNTKKGNTNMSIVSGYKKFKKYILTSSGFQLVSHWTNANTLQFDDGKTAQAKLGAIDGISSSKDSSSEKIAASTKLVSELNSNLGGLSFYEDNTGKYVVGADSVPKKLGNFERINLGSNLTSFNCSDIQLSLIHIYCWTNGIPFPIKWTRSAARGYPPMILRQLF